MFAAIRYDRSDFFCKVIYSSEADNNVRSRRRICS